MKHDTYLASILLIPRVKIFICRDIRNLFTAKALAWSGNDLQRLSQIEQKSRKNFRWKKSPGTGGNESEIGHRVSLAIV